MTQRACFRTIVVTVCFLCSQMLSAASYEEELTSLAAKLGDSLEKASLKTVAFAGIKNIEGKEPALGKLLVEELSVDLVSQDRGFSVVDRGNLTRLMEEHKLTDEGLAASENTKKLKLAGIDAIVFGVITPFEGTYRIQLKAIDTSSARLVAATKLALTRSEDLDKLMGIAHLSTQTVMPASAGDGTVSATPAVSESSQQRQMKFGKIRVDIDSVVFDKKTGSLRITYAVANTGGVRTQFEYDVFDKNAPEENMQNPSTAYRRRVKDGYKPALLAKGEANDDQGQSYSIVTPTDVTARPTLQKNSPVTFTLSYKMNALPGSTVQIPSKVTFWFGCHAGREQFRCSLSDCLIDKVQ